MIVKPNRGRFLCIRIPVDRVISGRDYLAAFAEDGLAIEPMTFVYAVTCVPGIRAAIQSGRHLAAVQMNSSRDWSLIVGGTHAGRRLHGHSGMRTRITPVI